MPVGYYLDCINGCKKTHLNCGWHHFLSRRFWTVSNGKSELSTEELAEAAIQLLRSAKYCDLVSYPYRVRALEITYAHCLLYSGGNTK